MTKFKGFDSNSEKAKKLDCQFGSNLFSIFTGKNPELDKIAKNLDFTPEYAIPFVLNDKDMGFLFFNKNKSSIVWVEQPITVTNDTQIVLEVLAQFKQYFESVQAVIQHI
jgi:hypothetical protein